MLYLQQHQCGNQKLNISSQTCILKNVECLRLLHNSVIFIYLFFFLRGETMLLYPFKYVWRETMIL